MEDKDTSAKAATVNVSLVGVGGQGIILTADILAKAAALAGYDVKKSGGSALNGVESPARESASLV